MRSFRTTLGSLFVLYLAGSLSRCGGSASDTGNMASAAGGAFPGTSHGSGSVQGTSSNSGGASGSTPGVDVPTNGPGFPGTGTMGAGDPITATPSPDTCGTRASQGNTPFAVVAPEVPVCYFPSGSSEPAAIVERVVEVAQNEQVIHVRLTLSPYFVDNTYGDNAVGWTSRAAPSDPAGAAGPAAGGPAAGGPAAGGPAAGGPAAGGPAAGGPAAGGPAAGGPAEKSKPGPADDAGTPGPKRPEKGKGHTFKDLVESDKAEFKMTDASGAVVLDFYVDYISEDATAPSGYGCLGVSGGEGKMLQGNASFIVAATTSLDRDLNACGYGSYVEDSPATDENYTPNSATPGWDYRVVYDVWVKASAFGTAGFGNATIAYVHASPSKASSDTLPVTPGPCPPGNDGGQSGGQGGGPGEDVDGGRGAAAGYGGEPGATWDCLPDMSPCTDSVDCCTGVCCRGICSAAGCVQ